MDDNRPQSYAWLLRDTALVVTALTALLFMWGFGIESFIALRRGVPSDLIPERSVSYYLSSGALVAITFYLPVALVAFGVVAVVRARKAKAGSPLTVSPKAALVLAVGLVALSIFALLPISQFASRIVTRKRVTAVTVSQGGSLRNKYLGWYLIGITPDSYVLADKWGESSATVSVLKRDEVIELEMREVEP